MTAGPVSSGSIAAFVNTIWQDALLVARENSLGPALVQVFTDARGTAIRSNATYGTATLSTVADTDDLTSQIFQPTTLSSLTPAEAGGLFLLTDTRIETDPFGVRNDAALELGQAVAEKIDTDIFGRFNELTGGTLGAVGSVATWSHFFGAMSILQAKHAPKPWVFVCHPYCWNALGKAASIGATVTNQPALQDEFARSFFVQNVAGVDIYVSSNTELSGGTASYNAMFSRSAIAYDIRRAPRLETERDASARATELVMSTLYATGVWRPAWGVQVLQNAAVPTV